MIFNPLLAICASLLMLQTQQACTDLTHLTARSSVSTAYQTVNFNTGWATSNRYRVIGTYKEHFFTSTDSSCWNSAHICKAAIASEVTTTLDGNGEERANYDTQGLTTGHRVFVTYSGST